MDEEIISIGAEAILIRTKLYGFTVIKKVRAPKSYRDSKLDEIIRYNRTITEAKIMIEAKTLGIPCPSIIEVDPHEGLIVMDYIDGPRLSDVLDKLQRDYLSYTFYTVGRYIGKLHENGIIHGDLTTSNMILHSDTVYLIDFGLSYYSHQLEDKGVDMHLFLRALESTHYSLSIPLFNEVIKGYSEVVGKSEANNVIKKIKEIRMRGRYVKERRKAKSDIRHEE